MGMLIGYVVAGIVMDQAGFDMCFRFAMLQGVIGLTLLLVFPIAEVRCAHTSDPHLPSHEAPQQRGWIVNAAIILVAGQWITGGSINVLEVPFAIDVLKVSEGTTTWLFFATATGSLATGFCLTRYPPHSSVDMLVSTTGTGAILIMMYIFILDLKASIVLLFFYGAMSSVQNFLVITLIQSHSSPHSVAKNIVVSSSVIQISGLVSAFFAVLFNYSLGPQLSCMIFCVATLGISAGVYSRNQSKAPVAAN